MKFGRKWAIGLLGGIIGLLSLALPWVSISVGVFSASLSIGLSPFDMLKFLGTNAGTSSSSTPVSPELSPFVERIQTGVGVMLLGIVIFIIGSLISLLKTKGGYVMLAGAILGTAGIGIFTFSVSTGGVSVGVGPGFGVVIAFVAAIIVLVGDFIKEPVLTTPQSTAVGYQPPPAQAAWPAQSQPAPLQQPAVQQAPVNPPAPTYQPAPVNPIASQGPQSTPGMGAQVPRNFCVMCGAPLPVGAAFCGACGANLG